MIAPPPTRRGKAAPPDETHSEFYELLDAARYVVRVAAAGRRVVRAEATGEERDIMKAMGRTRGERVVAFTLVPPATPPTRDDADLGLHLGMLDVLLASPWPPWVRTVLADEAMRWADRGLSLGAGGRGSMEAIARLDEQAPDLARRIKEGFAAVAEAATPGTDPRTLTLACCRLCDAVDEAKRLPPSPIAGDVPAELQAFVLP